MSSDLNIPDDFLPIGQDGTFLDHVGGILWRRTETHTDICLALRPQHLNPNGTAHGGVLLTLFDITLGATVESFLGQHPGRHPATIQMSTNMISPARPGALIFGEAAVEASTRTISFVTGRLHSAGHTVLSGSAVFRNPSQSQPR